MHKSIATIDSPEFINLQPLEINPLMQSCEIKVLYLGENRNRSYITKEVAIDMAKTLRGAPIVGYFKQDKKDFADHGQRVIMDDEGIKFDCLTKPYGFVAPDAQVWFQKFEDEDDFGNKIEREYLMTTGYLWSGQFEEAKLAIEEGRPQSMELDEETLDGHWATDNNSGMDFFIINDAIFSKLCILGDDVEPCFEGANVTSPSVSTTFSKINDNFKHTLYSMMQDLKKYALEGGLKMDNEKDEILLTETEEEVVNTESEVEEVSVETQEESAPEDTFVNGSENNAEVETTFDESGDGEETESDDSSDDEVETTSEETADSEPEVSEDLDEDVSTKKNEKYEALVEEYQKCKKRCSELEEENKVLADFKAQIDNEKKDALIDSFYMLSDEDKKEVMDNKVNYSLEEIEAKLSVICVRKKVSFDLEDNSKEETETPATTFNLNDVEDSVPAWIAALRNTQKQNQN